MAQLSASITEGGTATLVATPPAVSTAAAVTELGIASLASRQQGKSIVALSDRGRVKSTVIGGFVQRVTLTAHGVASLKSRVAAGVSLRSIARARDSLSALTALTMREKGRASVRQQAQAIYHKALTTRGVVTDFFARPGLGAFLRSHGLVYDSMEGMGRAVVHQQDTATMTSELGHQLLLTVVHAETVDVADDLTLNAVWHGYLSDRADFILDVVSPAGDVTTWAMNARTGAVTEYLDYSFNAFAKSGANTYLGAADDGLYELVGPDDAGVPIVADIVGGLVDFGGSFFTSMKAAYLGIRGRGEFFLKLTSGNGRTYTYGVKSRNLQTTRVDIGKGLRATYFTWELVSVGQDFDLIGVTFLPIQQTRRV